MTMTFWISYFIAAMATATMTLTISRGKVFRFFRLFLKKYIPFVFELVDCPYCLAHWVALFIATVIHLKSPVFMSTGLFNILLSAFALVPPACVIMAIVFKAIEVVGNNIND